MRTLLGLVLALLLASAARAQEIHLTTLAFHVRHEAQLRPANFGFGVDSDIGDGGTSFPVDEGQIGLIKSVDLESLIPGPWQIPIYDAVNYSLTNGLGMEWGFSYSGGLAENGGLGDPTGRRFDESLFWEDGFHDNFPHSDRAFEIAVSPAFVPPNGIDLKGSGYHVSRVEFELESFQLLPPPQRTTRTCRRTGSWVLAEIGVSSAAPALWRAG